MTQTMRERLIARAAEKLQAYDFGYDEAREGSGAEIVDAILAELRAESGPMLAAGYAAIGDRRLSTGQVADAFDAMIDAVRSEK